MGRGKWQVASGFPLGQSLPLYLSVNSPRQLLRFSSKFCLFFHLVLFLGKIVRILFLELIFPAAFFAAVFVYCFCFCFSSPCACSLFTFSTFSVSVHSCARQFSIQAFSISHFHRMFEHSVLCISCIIHGLTLVYLFIYTFNSRV